MIVVGLLVVFQRWRLVRENQRREVLDKRDAAMEGDATKRRKRFKYIL
jgi:hypothetical protein